MTMNFSSDAHLLDSIRRGDAAAFRELFYNYYARLCGFARTVSGRRDLAEEAVSKVFEELWRRRAELHITTGLRAWLYTAVRNQVIDRLRAGARMETVPLSEHHSGRLVDHDSAAGRIMLDEITGEVERLIAAMPEQRRMVFRLARLDGLRYREIAELLGISVCTVQNHMVAAMSQLAPELPGLRKIIAAYSVNAARERGMHWLPALPAV
jgi:RNA polymerase sigma-70 factor (ECF subfamily)